MEARGEADVLDDETVHARSLGRPRQLLRLLLRLSFRRLRLLQLLLHLPRARVGLEGPHLGQPTLLGLLVRRRLKLLPALLGRGPSTADRPGC